MIAKFLPLLIGSLPLSAVEKAIEAVFSCCPNTPSWPQLPKLSPFEGMNLQYLEGIPGWQINQNKVIFKPSQQVTVEFSDAINKVFSDDVNAFAITEKHSACLNPFLEQLKNRDVEIVKGQVIGPVTFLTSHKIEDFVMLIKDDGYRELIPRILWLKAKFQIKRFKDVSPDSNRIIFFDEPILSQIGSAVTSINKEDIAELFSIVTDSLDCYKGVHICGNSDWDFILSLPIDIVNFDAFSYGDNFLLYRDAIEDFISRGGYIAAGIIPTDSESLSKTNEETAMEKAKRFMKELKSIVNEDNIYNRVFITPACGMGTLTEAEAYKAMGLLKHLSEKLVV